MPFPAPPGSPPIADPQALFHKQWRSHLVEQDGDGEALLYVDRHLVYEVTSPQVFEGLRIAGREPWRRETVIATADHNVPTTHAERVSIDAITDPQSRLQVRQLDINCKEFSCEHALWALQGSGIRALVAPSFADILCGNCFTNGMLPNVLNTDTVDRLFAQVAAQPGMRWTIHLPAQTLTPEGAAAISFDTAPEHKHYLLNGLDPIAPTLAKASAIRPYEKRRSTQEPWLFD